MSEGTTVSQLFNRMGGRIKDAVDAHKNDEVKGGFADLPEIKSGVAKLTRIEFYEKEGVAQFRAIGVVDAPMYGEGGVPIRGLETSQFAVITEADADKGVSDVLEVVRKMVGQETLSKLIAAYPSKETGYDLLKVVAAVQAATTKDPIYFRFSNKFEENKSGRMDAKSGKPFPGRTWQRWQLVIPGYAPLHTSGAPTASSNGHKPAADPNKGDLNEIHKTMDAATPKGKAKTPAKPTAVAPVKPEPTTINWEEMAERASNEDQGAKDAMSEAATALGFTDVDISAADSWDDVAGWLVAGVPKGEAKVVVGDDEPKNIPVVGNNVKFLPPYPKDKTGVKRDKNKIDCEITNVHADRTMDLIKIGDSTKMWLAISWSDPHVEYPS